MSGKKSLNKQSRNSVRSPRTGARLSFSRRGSDIERGRRDSLSKSAALSDRLLRAETLLSGLEDLAGAGTWEFGSARRDFCYSANLAKILGLPLSSDSLPLAELADRLEPGNPESIEARVAEVLSSRVSMVHYSEQNQSNGRARNRRTLFLPLPSGDSSAPRVVGITQDISSACAAEDEVRALSHRLLSAQSEEQRRLSRNLHETVSQTLCAIKLTLGKIGRSLPDQATEAARGVAIACDLVQDALREVRSVAALLHPPLLDEAGLCAALRSYTRTFSDRSGLDITVNCPDRLARMEDEIEVSVFRIVQESLTNIHRHAKAKNALIRISQSDQLMSFDICDDGVGLPESSEPGVPQVPDGVGIAGMRERIRQLNGSFRIHGIHGGGTVVSVSLPIQLKSSRRTTRS